jgi:hypothetical protein
VVEVEQFLDYLNTPAPEDDGARAERRRHIAETTSLIKAMEPEIDRIDERAAELDRRIETKRLMRETELGLRTMKAARRASHRGRPGHRRVRRTRAGPKEGPSEPPGPGVGDGRRLLGLLADTVPAWASSSSCESLAARIDGRRACPRCSLSPSTATPSASRSKTSRRAGANQGRRALFGPRRRRPHGRRARDGPDRNEAREGQQGRGQHDPRTPAPGAIRWSGREGRGRVEPRRR